VLYQLLADDKYIDLRYKMNHQDFIQQIFEQHFRILHEHSVHAQMFDQQHFFVSSQQQQAHHLPFFFIQTNNCTNSIDPDPNPNVVSYDEWLTWDCEKQKRTVGKLLNDPNLAYQTSDDLQRFKRSFLLSYHPDKLTDKTKQESVQTSTLTVEQFDNVICKMIEILSSSD